MNPLDSVSDLCSLGVAASPTGYVAADYEFVARLDGRRLGTIYMAPSLVGAAVTGLAIREGLLGPGGIARVERVERLPGHRYLVDAYSVPGGEPKLPLDAAVPWRLVERLYARSISLVSKKRCPYALHALLLYMVEDGEVVGEVGVVDPSRHSAALKAAGLASALARRGLLEGRTLVAVSTGRISGDAVEALSRIGARIIVSNHHPLASGVAAAVRERVTLVLRRPDGAGLAAYTSPWRVPGAPIAAAAEAAAVARSPGHAEEGVVVPLC